MEKKVLSRADALKKVQKIVKRIEEEKAELRKELEITEAELYARATGTTKASGFNIKTILENDNNETVALLERKIAKIKNALAKPYYADEEYRVYSILYLKGELPEHQAERNGVTEEIKKLRHDLIVIPQEICELEKKRNAFIDKFARKMIDIGLSSETECIALYGAEHILDRYESKCDEYENN